MDDGELEFSNQEVFSNPEAFSNSIGEVPSSSRSMDSFLDEILKDARACTHTHTCNPPGPDSTHTHTCFHVHTKIVPASSEEKADDTAESAQKKPAGKKRPLGNREAVRKYREKKKARAASLEDEVVRLRALNQQLLRRLQGQAALEAEIARLKCLLVDIRGRIDGEIGSFPYQKPVDMSKSMAIASGAYVMNRCNVQCGNQMYCLHPNAKDGDGAGVNGQVYRGGCEFDNQSMENQSNNISGLKEVPDCGVPGMDDGTIYNVISSGGGKKKKGSSCAATAC